MSRTPVREALVQLQSEGLVVMRPQSGTFVVDLTIEDVRDICATRAILEAGAIRLAAETGSADLMARLGLLVGRAAIALDDGDLVLCDELDCQFHEGIVAASANAYLIRAYSGISDELRALRHRLSREPSRMARAIAQHRHIIDLWAAGRLDQATAEISSHVINVARLLTAIGADGSVNRLKCRTLKHGFKRSAVMLSEISQSLHSGSIGNRLGVIAAGLSDQAHHDRRAVRSRWPE